MYINILSLQFFYCEWVACLKGRASSSESFCSRVMQSITEGVKLIYYFPELAIVSSDLEI